MKPASLALRTTGNSPHLYQLKPKNNPTTAYSLALITLDILCDQTFGHTWQCHYIPAYPVHRPGTNILEYDREKSFDIVPIFSLSCSKNHHQSSTIPWYKRQLTLRKP